MEQADEYAERGCDPEHHWEQEVSHKDDEDGSTEVLRGKPMSGKCLDGNEMEEEDDPDDHSIDVEAELGGAVCYDNDRHGDVEWDKDDENQGGDQRLVGCKQSSGYFRLVRVWRKRRRR